MNMTVLFKKYTYGLLLIATTLIGFAFNFTSAGSYTYNGTANFSIPTNTATNGVSTFSFPIPISISNFSSDLGTVNISCDFDNFNNHGLEFTLSSPQNIGGVFRYTYFTSVGSTAIYVNHDIDKVFGAGNFTDTFNVSDTKFISSLYLNFYVRRPHDATTLTFNYSCVISGDNIYNQNSSSSCNPSGQCTVSDKVSENILFNGSKSFSSAGYTNMFNYGTEGAGTYCVKFTSSNAQQLTMGFANGGTTAPSNLYTLYADQYGNTICLYGNKPYFNVKLNASSNTIDYEVYKLTDLLSDDIPCTQNNQQCPECKTMTSAECQTEYDLIPEEDIDQEYCINANLCPILQGSGDVQWSALYINNVQHLGNDIINIDIPEEIEREYYYNSGETNVEIVGYGYDQEKMQSMVNTQFTPPSAEDMENIISKVADFLPLVAIMLLIVYAWWLIKKVFKIF